MYSHYCITLYVFTLLYMYSHYYTLYMYSHYCITLYVFTLLHHTIVHVYHSHKQITGTMHVTHSNTAYPSNKSHTRLQLLPLFCEDTSWDIGNWGGGRGVRGDVLVTAEARAASRACRYTSWGFVCVTWLIHTCDVTHSYVWRDSLRACRYTAWDFICVTLLSHMCDMTHVWYDSFTLVTWLIYLCGMTHW